MGRNLFFTFFAVLIVGALILAGILVFSGNDINDPESDRINELYSEKSKISYDIDKYRTELEKLTVTKAGVFFLFEHLEAELIDNALPLLQENGNYNAIVSVSPDEYKKSEIYTELEKQGWEFAIGFDDNYTFPESDEDAAQALEEHINLYGAKGKTPTIINFSSGNAKYRRGFDEVLKKNGIRVVIAPRILLAGGNDYLDYDHESGLLKISSIPFSVTSTVESTMRSHINTQKPLALSVKHLETQVPAISDKLSTEKFGLMLNYLEDYKDIHIGTCLPYRDFVASEHDKNIVGYNDILKKIEEASKRIAEIEAEIESLMGKSPEGVPQ